jgi:hypothetical protein
MEWNVLRPFGERANLRLSNIGRYRIEAFDTEGFVYASQEIEVRDARYPQPINNLILIHFGWIFLRPNISLEVQTNPINTSDPNVIVEFTAEYISGVHHVIKWVGQNRNGWNHTGNWIAESEHGSYGGYGTFYFKATIKGTSYEVGSFLSFELLEGGGVKV